jgi:hypothetical protein
MLEQHYLNRYGMKDTALLKELNPRSSLSITRNRHITYKDAE